jgi:hypothetical protein
MTSSKRTARAVVIASFSLASILALYAIGGLAMTAALTASLSVSEASAASGDNSSNSNNNSDSDSSSSNDGNRIDKSEEGQLLKGVRQCFDSSNDNSELEKCLNGIMDKFFVRNNQNQSDESSNSSSSE